MSNQTPDAKDGFDFLEYPCLFPFKAMCRTGSADSKVVVKQLVLLHVSEERINEVQEKSSRTGKFISVTITVELADRETLEAIYKELADCNEVVMTL